MWDIRNIGIEYMLAEKSRKEGDYEAAIMHYKAAINNYEFCDNEYLLSTNSPYTVEEMGIKTSYPSIDAMVDKSYREIRKLKKKLHNGL